jgi:hypothetical protein
MHHTDPAVTEEHYNRATSLTAVGKLREAMRKYVSESAAKPESR